MKTALPESMASDTRSPWTTGTKSWEVARMRPMKLLARIMLGQRASSVRDLGGRTESLKQSKSVGNIFKHSIDIKNLDTVGKMKDLADKLTTLRKTLQNFPKPSKIFQNFSNLSTLFKTFLNFSKLFNKMKTFHKTFHHG